MQGCKTQQVKGVAYTVPGLTVVPVSMKRFTPPIGYMDKSKKQNISLAAVPKVEIES